MAILKTNAMDLRGGQSVWARTGQQIRVKSRGSAETCDVVIVGCGVSGALIGQHLALLGLDVVLVDKRCPARGSTIASTAMIQFEIDTPLIELADRLGARKAERAYLRSAKAVADLGSMIRKHQIVCGWKDRSALLLTGTSIGHRGLREEAKYRRRIGLPSEFIGASELEASYGFKRTGAIASNLAAELNPLALTLNALRAVKRSGARIYSPHCITEIECASRGVTLHARQTSMKIVAKKAIFATGYETIAQIPSKEYNIISSWAIATQPLNIDQFWPTQCLGAEASDPYLYMRATADQRILVGGEDAKTADPKKRDALIPEKALALMRKLKKLLPGRDFTVEYAWAGAFADSPTGLPFIGEVDGLPNCMAVLGCGGNGITFSVIAADICAAWSRGRKDADSNLFC